MGAMSRPHAGRRKCRCCSTFFVPDPRTMDRQRYCSKPGCRHASKRASQQRWWRKNGNGDHFRGPGEVARVQEWRRRHPGYWKPKSASSQRSQPAAYQGANPGQSSRNVPPKPAGTLQDDCLVQHPVVVGLISMLTGGTLQEDIEATARHLLLRGRNILGLSQPPTTSVPTPSHDHQTPASSRARPPSPAEFQLD